MFEIGGSLREARLKRNLTPADVQKAIRIRDRYLQALEEERWELLPGDAYVKGFLRTYADYLGLDGNLYVEEYNSRFAHPDEPQLVPERFARTGTRFGGVGFLRPLIAIAVIVVIVARAAVAAWQLSDSSGGKQGSAADDDSDHDRRDDHLAPTTPKKTHKTHVSAALSEPRRGRGVARQLVALGPLGQRERPDRLRGHAPTGQDAAREPRRTARSGSARRAARTSMSGSAASSCTGCRPRSATCC